MFELSDRVTALIISNMNLIGTKLNNLEFRKKGFWDAFILSILSISTNKTTFT